MIWFVTNVDTEILAARVAIEALPAEFPAVRAARPEALDVAGGGLDGATCVLVRLLGGRRAWQPGFEELRARCTVRGVPLLAFAGEAVPDAELASLSTVPSALVSDAFAYLVNGGPDNIAQLLRFVADTVLREGFGFDPPTEIPMSGTWRVSAREPGDERPLVGVVFYRAHLVAGNTRFVDDLCDAIEASGAGVLAMWCYSLRGDAATPVLEQLARAGIDVLITTVLASGGAAAGAGIVHADGAGGAGGAGDGWDASALAALGVTIVQAPSCGSTIADWLDDDRGLGPYDATSGVAIPELDGRIIGPAFAFNEIVDDGGDLGVAVRAYRTVPDRVERLVGLALRHARLRRLPVSQRRVAVVISAYPTRRSRLGNAVGLDSAASAIELLRAMAAGGYAITGVPEHGDALMAELADGLTYDEESLTAEQLARAVGRLAADDYAGWFATLPAEARAELEVVWGPAPGTQRVHDGALVFSGIDLGNVVVAIQPPRGQGHDPFAVYHSPSTPPLHHYLAFYRWLDEVWGADAIVHLGKHGTLEWLPGKSLALSAGCWPDAALGCVPLFYPFVVNDPGEGAQAKRRTHAVIIDHLLPPMTRADTYDETAALEQLFDEYSQVQSLDPSKLPALRARIWDTLRSAAIDRDLGLDAPPVDDGSGAGGADRAVGAADADGGAGTSSDGSSEDGGFEDGGFEDESFDDVIGEVDGYLCELKDAQIRGGLHTLGVAPEGEALVDLVLAITRLGQGSVPSLRATVAGGMGVDLADPTVLDAVEARCRALVESAAARGWVATSDDPETIAWVCTSLVPNLRRATDEIGNLLTGLAGGHVPAGPSGTLTRGGAHVLPTGRNFYAVDPKALPSELSWEVGRKLADALIARHLDEEGTHPDTVGLVLWGTALMRTQGDDVAQILALLGIRPVWERESRRVVGLEVIPLAELGRPRIDVTVRISGFFRDAFPHLVHLVDDAVGMAAALDEDPADNRVRASASDDPRIFGPPPGAYGVGIGVALEQRSWRSDEDLAAIYTAWSGTSYTRRGYGVPDEEAMRRRFGAIDVAVKNQDTREHDIFDSEEYLQDHGGMVATIRALTGADPKAWLGDSSDPARPRVRSLAEEAARVVRTRVVNPRWIAAMQRHGYKGAFEMAATVDYLFGYDATARVVDDWMYEKVTQAYVADPEVRAFFQRSNPWALGSIAQRLLEAVDRKMWDASPQAVETLQRAVLEAEGWEEQR